jgi:hypothetical protein
LVQNNLVLHSPDKFYDERMGNIIVNLDYVKIIEHLETNKDLSRIAIDLMNYLDQYDLSIETYEPEPKSRLFFGKRKDGPIEIFENKVIMKFAEFNERYKFVDKLLNYDKTLITLSKNNFFISKNLNLIASKDFRVVVYDSTNKIPQKILLYAASVALMVISGKLEAPIGYQAIRDIMDNYGMVEFNYQVEGYMRIDINKSEGFNHKFKSSIEMTPKPKKF